MSDIFISYKREEQPVARKLANALESEGWTVWWDPKLRAGEHFDDVIEKALNEAKCVIVMWSSLAVNSEYIKAEATEALEQRKLVPVKIANVSLPFRFKRVHTLSLLGWDGSKDASDFRELVHDIAEIVGLPVPEAKSKARGQRTAEQERLREQEQQWSEEEATPKADEALEKLLKFRQRAIPKPATVFRDKMKGGSEGPEMVVIPAGIFRMGDMSGDESENNEQPTHTVRIIRPFAMGRYEVTFEEYGQFAVAGRKSSGNELLGRDRRPVIDVSWEDAVDYTKWLSAQTGKRYRLPTEAEWEYAARAGTETEYWWGNEIMAGVANCDDGSSEWSGKQLAPVGSFKPNPFGLYDTAGNVWEWVQDCWHDNYNGAPADGSAWKETGGGSCALRVMRGGCWNSTPMHLRSSNRARYNADNRNNFVGFRLAQDID